MKIYLAGPMRGYPEFNFPAFREATNMLRSYGHEVFSPAEADDIEFGKDVSKGNATGDEEKAAREVGLTGLALKRNVFGRDTAYICQHAEAIAMLPGWEHSRGAQAEWALARALGLEIIYLRPESPL